MKRHSAPSGVALIMAVSVLAALVAISVPFLLSMILHGRTARVDLNAAQAQAGADGALSRGMAHLYRNLLKSKGYDPSPDLDTPDELFVSMALPNLDVQNPYGELWSCRIEDEQGKINLNSAPPNLIGNLLASSTLAESVQKGATGLLVNDSNAFPTDGDPETIDGFVRIDGDVVPYCHVSGGTVRLKPQGDYVLYRNHRKGALVYDGRASWIADYKFRPGSRVFRPFRSIYEIKMAGGGHPLLAIRADEFAQVEPFITAHSGRDGPMWGKAEVCRGTIDATRRGFAFKDNRGFGPGTIVRLAQHGSALTHGRVERVFTRFDRTVIVLEHEVGVTAVGSGTENEIFLEPEMRHPININTAPKEVVVACLVGVGLSNHTETVTREQADMVADLMKRGVYRSAEDLRSAIDAIKKRGILTGQLADAVYINATEPNSPKIRGNTVPFCFRNYGGFTLEGSAVINAENGVPMARSTIRQVVTLPTPPPGQFELKTQEDFELLIDKGLTQKTVTWPTALNPWARVRGARTEKLPDPERGAMRLSTGKTGSHKGYALDEFLTHCDNHTDSRFFQDGFDLTRRSAGWQLKAPRLYKGHMPATGVELWVNPKGTSDMTFFDSGETADRNRTLFKYEPGAGGLVIEIWDANLKGDAVKYVWPYTVEGGDWQHIAGSWRSSLPGGQEIRVDARTHTEDALPYFEPSAQLANDLDVEDVGDTSMLSMMETRGDLYDYLPEEGGAVRIGAEIIEYKERQGDTLRGLRRGTRMSAAAPHYEGETIIPYGYSCAMQGPLAIGGATLVDELNTNVTTRVDAPKTKYPDYGIGYNETGELPVDSTFKFPSSGFILVSGELIYYGAKAKNGKAFEKLQRAQTARGRGADARDLRDNQTVRLVSILVTKHNDYEDSGYVQIDDSNATVDADQNPKVEWLRYESKESRDGKAFLLAEIRNVSPPSNITQLGISKPRRPRLGDLEFRGRLGTQESRHDAGEKVIPVVRMSGPQCGDQYMRCAKGVSDVDIILRGYEASEGTEERWIKRAYVQQHDHWNYNSKTNVWTFGHWWFHYWVGLDDFVDRRYPPGTGRIHKFPSGELPDVVRPRYVAQGMQQGGVPNGDVDEVKVISLPSRGAKIAWDESKGLNYGISAADNTMLIELPEAWPRPNGAGSAFLPNGWPRSGLIRLENGDESEFMFYESTSTTTLKYHADVLCAYEPLKEYGPPPPRNLNGKINHEARNPGTKIWEEHPNNDNETRQVLRLSGLKRGLLNTEATDFPPGTGVMLYDAAPFTILRGSLGNRGGRLSLLDEKGFPIEEGYAWINDEVVSWYKKGYELGDFRGRYGTLAQSHSSGDLVRCLPYRYYDRDVTEYLGDGLAFMQAGHYAADAVWQYLEVKYDSGAFGKQPIPRLSKPRILVRFDGQPRWDEPPTNKPGGIFQFYGGGVLHFRGRGPGGGVVGNQIEIRIYWHYDKGAFDQPDWKRCFGIQSLKASYFSPLVTHRVDEIERR